MTEAITKELLYALAGRERETVATMLGELTEVRRAYRTVVGFIAVREGIVIGPGIDFDPDSLGWYKTTRTPVEDPPPPQPEAADGAH